MHHEVKQKQLWNKTVPSALVRRLMSLVFSFSKSKFVTPFPFCVCVLKLHTRLPFRCVRLYGNIRMALQNPPSLNTWSLRNSSPDLDYIIKFFFFLLFSRHYSWINEVHFQRTIQTERTCKLKSLQKSTSTFVNNETSGKSEKEKKEVENEKTKQKRGKQNPLQPKFRLPSPDWLESEPSSALWWKKRVVEPPCCLTLVGKRVLEEGGERHSLGRQRD